MKRAMPAMRRDALNFIKRNLGGWLIILPSLAPYLKSACHVALGLCWKAGVAAEVMAVANRSVGGMLYDAKVYLEISDLFAWTVLLVAVSILFEKAFLWLLDLCVNRAIRWES